MNITKCLRIILQQRQVYLSDLRCLSCYERRDPYILHQKLPIRFVSTYEVKNVDKGEGLLSKITSKISFFNLKNIKIKSAGYILYENIADKIDYFAWFDEFDLPDTFYSWFVVTELHIWMLSTRAMAEGTDGRTLRNSMVEALWKDVAERMKKIGHIDSNGRRYYIKELSEQFQAALIAYDEGLYSEDTVLAGALWRRMYQMDAVHLEHIEQVVQHVRKQVCLLDNISRDQLFVQKNVNWEPIRNK